MLRIAFSVLLLVHGLIHVMGFVKGLGLAEVEALHLPISRTQGLLWLLAALLFVAGAALSFAGSRLWWMAAAPALVLSQVLIVGAWSDAKFGTIANAIIALPLALALVDLRPGSLSSIHRRAVAAELARVAAAAPPATVTDADLSALPPVVQRWLRRVGVVGKPRVRDLRATFRGAIRSGADAPWLSFTSEQYNFHDRPARLFMMEASLLGVPFQSLHLAQDGHATMQVRVLSLFDQVDARGPEMDRSETVTLLNDLCVLAPAALLDVDLTWGPASERSAQVTFRHAGQTVSASLSFDEAGDLVDFVSDDRSQTTDGASYRRLPWSTPLREHREFAGVRLPARGEAVWRTPEGDLIYGRFDLQEIAYNVER